MVGCRRCIGGEECGGWMWIAFLMQQDSAQLLLECEWKVNVYVRMDAVFYTGRRDAGLFQSLVLSGKRITSSFCAVRDECIGCLCTDGRFSDAKITIICTFMHDSVLGARLCVVKQIFSLANIFHSLSHWRECVRKTNKSRSLQNGALIFTGWITLYTWSLRCEEGLSATAWSFLFFSRLGMYSSGTSYTIWIDVETNFHSSDETKMIAKISDYSYCKKRLFRRESPPLSNHSSMVHR